MTETNNGISVDTTPKIVRVCVIQYVCSGGSGSYEGKEKGK